MADILYAVHQYAISIVSQAKGQGRQSIFGSRSKQRPGQMAGKEISQEDSQS